MEVDGFLLVALFPLAAAAPAAINALHPYGANGCFLCFFGSGSVDPSSSAVGSLVVRGKVGDDEEQAANMIAFNIADLLLAAGALPSPRQVGQIQQDFILEPAFVRPTHP